MEILHHGKGRCEESHNNIIRNACDAIPPCGPAGSLRKRWARGRIEGGRGGDGEGWRRADGATGGGAGGQIQHADVRAAGGRGDGDDLPDLDPTGRAVYLALFWRAYGQGESCCEISQEALVADPPWRQHFPGRRPGQVQAEVSAGAQMNGGLYPRGQRSGKRVARPHGAGCVVGGRFGCGYKNL